jgi:hypothetical protein
MASWSPEPSDGNTGASIARLEVDPAASDEEGPPKSSEELDRVLTNLSRRDSTTSATGAAPAASPPREVPAQLLRIHSNDATAPVATD